jgi:hypothetical protein
LDPKIHIEVNRLKKFTTWIPLNPQFNNLHNSHLIIQALNTIYLHQYNKDIHHDHNLQMFHILYLIKTKIHHALIDVPKFINSWKNSYISILKSHGLMMMYDIHMHLNSFNTVISDGSEYISTSFNINT